MYTIYLFEFYIGHKDLVLKAKILHSDISLNNLLLSKIRLNDLRRGLLIDFDYAKDVDPTRPYITIRVEKPEVWPGNRKKETAGLASQQNKFLSPDELQMKSNITDYAQHLRKVRGHRTVSH